MLKVSVVLPTHAPHGGRFARTLAGLCAQSLPSTQWELVVVDNASPTPVTLPPAPELPAETRIIREPLLGLTPARRRGLAAARGDWVVLVDDDNVLATDYLAQVVALFAAHPKLGAAGGRIIGEFEKSRPGWWQPQFDDLLACRDLGTAPQICPSLLDASTGRAQYPHCAPVGAGMALRRAALAPWLADESTSDLPDRRGRELSSSGDNDIVFSVLRAGWSVGYFPSLALTHLIPAVRLERDYLARLNRGIARSWMQVLRKHDASPWPSVAPWTVPLRQLKAWFAYRAWSSPAAHIRWQGACGHFEGRSRR